MVGIAAGRLFLGVAQGFIDLCAAIVQAEHAVREHAKVARSRVGDYAHLFFAILDIVTDGSAVGVVHARVHGKAKLHALGLEPVVQFAELAPDVAVPVIQEQAHVFLGQIDRTNGVVIALILKITAIRGRRRNRAARQERGCKKQSAHHSSRSRRTVS